MTLIRTIWAGLNLIVATIPISLVAIIAALLRVRGGIYDDAGRLWSRWILRASGTRVRVEGFDNIRKDRPQIVASNHESWYDVFAIAATLPGRFKFVAKKELANIPFFGWGWRAAGHISIDRSNTQAAIRSLDQASQAMRRDHAKVVIFPEGTRSSTGELMPFKKGAFMLALHTGIEIVPAGVHGGRGILRKGDWRIHKGTIVLRFGEPIPTEGYAHANRDQLVARVRAEVARLRAPDETNELDDRDDGGA